MNNKKLHIILIFLLIWSFSFAQKYKNYSTKDGLPSNHVYTIVQDAKGFIWFLTDKGMARYDGNQLKTFTTKEGLPNNDVWDAFPTPDGKVWYMSKSTKLGYVINDTILSFSNKNKDEIITPIHTSQVQDAIYPAQSNTSFALKENVWVSETNTMSTNLEKETWLKLWHKDIEHLGFNEMKQELCLLDHNQNKIATIPASNVYGPKGVRGQLNDSLYYWTTDKNYSILNFFTKKLKQVNLQEAIGIAEVPNLRINVVNNELQVTGNGFVAVLDKHFEIKNPFFFPKHIQAHFGFLDKLNTLWLATFNKGVYKLPYVKRGVDYKLQNDKIQSFDVVNGDLVAGVFQKGFYKYNPKEKSFQHFIDKKDYVFGVSEVKSMQTNFYAFRNELLKETDGKITAIDLSNVFKYELDDNSVGRKLVYFKDKLFGNSSFGVNKFNPIPLKIEKQFSQKGCNDMVVFKNKLLIATTSGLKEIRNDTLMSVFKNNSFNKSILSIHPIDDKHVLLNTDGYGSYITDLNTLMPLPKTSFLTVEDAFLEDNTIWLASNTGVLKFTKNKTNFHFEKRFTISDGLPTNHVKTVYVNNESLIVGTNTGVAILPKNQESIPQLIDLYIEKAKYFEKNITPNNSSFQYEENNVVNFTVSNIDFSENRTDYSYKYKLEPVQNKWITSKTNSFNFNDLKPGDYTFVVSTNTIVKELKFQITPLWWQQFWVKVILSLIIASIIIYGLFFLFKRLAFKKNQKLFEDKRLSELQLKALRSQMNPHFVFNSLSAIQYYINENDFKASETYLVMFSKLIRQFFALSKENDIVLEQEINLLKNYLDVEKLRFREKLNYKINVDKALDITTIKIPTMLLQPIVENAVNHGIFNKIDTGLIVLNFISVADNVFKVEIIDDGVGFVNTQKRKNKNVKSSHVLTDRLHFLNQSGSWKITYVTEEVAPENVDKGNRAIFIIKKR